MRDRSLRFVLAAILPALLAAGCVAGSEAGSRATARPAPRAGYEPLPAGAKRVVSESNGLRFTAEVTSTTLATGTPLTIRMTLSNETSHAIRWNDFVGFGWFTDDPDTWIGVAVGGDGGPRFRRAPLLLRSGEVTSDVVAAGLGGGTHRIFAFYEGSTGDPSGRSPELTITVSGAPALIGPLWPGAGGAIRYYTYLRGGGKFTEARKLWWPRTIENEGENIPRGWRIVSENAARKLSNRVVRKYRGRFAQVAEFALEVAKIDPKTGADLSRREKRWAIVGKETADSDWYVAEISVVP